MGYLRVLIHMVFCTCTNIYRYDKDHRLVQVVVDLFNTILVYYFIGYSYLFDNDVRRCTYLKCLCNNTLSSVCKFPHTMS